jgi:hypothetical protein
MGDKMTPVYSGGLMYEYALEENGYGIAKIPSPKASRVEPQKEFARFATALKDNPAPTGDGGAATETHAVPCPAKGKEWLVEGTLLPAIPEGAKKVGFLSLAFFLVVDNRHVVVCGGFWR